MLRVDADLQYKCYGADEADIVGRAVADSVELIDIEVPSPDLIDLFFQTAAKSLFIPAGRKCGHGVYIPYTSPDPHRAEFCSLCYPYVIKIKENSNGHQDGLPGPDEESSAPGLSEDSAD